MAGGDFQWGQSPGLCGGESMCENDDVMLSQPLLNFDGISDAINLEQLLIFFSSVFVASCPFKNETV